MKTIRAAVIGVGHLGKEHARILTGFAGVELVGVADVHFELAQAVARKHRTQAFADYWPLLNLVDAASIVVPTSHHLAVAREFLKRGIPVLVEKPLALNAGQARELVELAEGSAALLQVGHIERFNPAYENLRSRAFTPKLIRAERLGPFTGRSTDIGVVLDLMIHDLDLVLSLARAPLSGVEAAGVSCFGGHEDVASARLRFADGMIAELTASRASPTASRQMQLWGPEGYAELDFAARTLTLVQPSEAVRRHGLDPARLDPASRARLRDELFTRHLETRTIAATTQDQLTRELTEFIDCVRTGQAPRVAGREGLAAIEAADRILASLAPHRWDASAGLLFPHRVDQEVA